MFRAFEEPRPGVLHFDVHAVDVSILNSIRRTVKADIPNVGFFFDVNDHGEDRHIRCLQNTSSLHNEFLAHRISMIPLHFSPEEIATYHRKKYRYVLQKKNTEGLVVPVTTEDFQIFDQEGELMPDTFRKRIFPPFSIRDPDTGAKREFYPLIVQLKPNQHNLTEGGEIHVEAEATVGVGRDACYAADSMCTYGYKPVTPPKGQAVDEQQYMQNEEGEPIAFEVRLETECAMTPAYLWTRAMDLLLERILQIGRRSTGKEVDWVNGITYGWQQEDEGYFSLRMEGESDTAGNLLQSLLLKRDVQGSSPLLSYVGYFCPHPQEVVCVLKIKWAKTEATLEMVEAWWQDALKSVVEHLRKIRLTWAKELPAVLAAPIQEILSSPP